MEHTNFGKIFKLPLALNRHGDLVDADGNDVPPLGMSPEDERVLASSIVHAVNCYDDMLTTLKEAEPHLTDFANDVSGMLLRRRVRAVIAKAESA